VADDVDGGRAVVGVGLEQRSVARPRQVGDADNRFGRTVPRGEHDGATLLIGRAE